MKLKYKMITMDVGGEIMAIPVESEENHRIILRMNGTMADILKALENNVTEDEIVAAMEKKYDAPVERIRANIQKVVNTLRENRLICE